MKGFTGLEIAIMFISAVLVFIMVLGVFGYTKGLTAGMCEFCIDMVDNYIWFMKPGWINPCVQVMHCCDKSTGADCSRAGTEGGSLGGFGGSGSTTTTVLETW
jgi:hypothetical protein